MNYEILSQNIFPEFLFLMKKTGQLKFSFSTYFSWSYKRNMYLTNQKIIFYPQFDCHFCWYWLILIRLTKIASYDWSAGSSLWDDAEASIVLVLCNYNNKTYKYTREHLLNYRPLQWPLCMKRFFFFFKKKELLQQHPTNTKAVPAKCGIGKQEHTFAYNQATKVKMLVQ